MEAAYKVLEACPDAEWRLVFALSRFGGLRCPSEHLALTWPDVDWERNRFRVDSPKTGVRWVPIFAELRPYLAEAFEQAPEGALYLINRYRDVQVNLRTQLLRIIRKAGLEPWPKLFHNLRASRETELAAEHPIHVVCALDRPRRGHCPKALPPGDRCRFRARGPEQRAKTARGHAENAAQNPARTVSHGASGNAKNPGNSEVFREIPSTCEVSGSAPYRTRTYNPLIKSQLLCQLS